MVWLDPGNHWNVQGAVQFNPSTVNVKPAGVLVIVVVGRVKPVGAALSALPAKLVP